MTLTLKNVDPWTAAANVKLSDTDYDVPCEATLQMVAMIRLVLLQCPVNALHQVSCRLWCLPGLYVKKEIRLLLSICRL